MGFGCVVPHDLMRHYLLKGIACGDTILVTPNPLKGAFWECESVAPTLSLCNKVPSCIRLLAFRGYNSSKVLFALPRGIPW